MPDIPPLHPTIGPQCFVVAGVTVAPNSPRVVTLSREALEHIWRALHELQWVAEHPETRTD